MRNRLHAICPYFAMFPERFVERYVKALSAPSDYVFDPFSGRGTTLLQSLLMERNAAATDINPVAFCISGAKAQAPRLDTVLEELEVLAAAYRKQNQRSLSSAAAELPPFFRRAFYPSTLRQLIYLRRTLQWRSSRVQRFVTALTLGILHGEMDRSERYLSNQMPRTICPKPRYSVKYWSEQQLWPKKRDVFGRLAAEAALRLRETPGRKGKVALADARKAAKQFPALAGKVKLVITSPPYFNVTNFEEDQWLRLWFLGHEPRPTYGKISKDDRHEVESAYWAFLAEVWKGVAPLLKRNAILVCRLGGTGMKPRAITLGIKESLRTVFPGVRLMARPRRSELTKRQTPTFRPGSIGCRFEVDYVFALGRAAIR